MRKRHTLLAGIALSLLAAAQPATAQFGGLGDAAKRLGNKLPDVSGALQGKPPITTSLEDAKFAVDSLDTFTPKDFKRITALQRAPSGGFVLQNGAYAYQAQSYCLKAGTHGPGRGDGYLFAPTDGPAEKAVESIVRNSVAHPEIPQHKIQTLLWAIIARAKFEDLSTEDKATAAKLLTAEQIATLNRSALDLLPGPAMDRALDKMPPLARQIFEAEARLRQMLVNPTTSFAELERVAVLAGDVGLGPGSRNVPTGRWSLHPDGYFVRYIPSGYSSTRVEIWVPQGSPAVGKAFDPATHIAMPGNTSRQRLIQSARLRADAD